MNIGEKAVLQHKVESVINKILKTFPDQEWETIIKSLQNSNNDFYLDISDLLSTVYLLVLFLIFEIESLKKEQNGLENEWKL